MPSQYEVALVLSAKNLASTAIGEVISGLDTLQGKVAGVGGAAQTLLPLAAGSFAGLTAALGTSVAAAAGFEKTMDGVRAVMDDAEIREFGGALDTLALKLGKDTVFSAQEAGRGIEELVKGGVSVTNILNGAADATLNLAAAGGTDLATAAEIASNALNAFNLKGTDMEDVANKIAGAANASAIDVNDFKFSLAASGAVAAQVGLSFGDLSTAIALMGNAGIKGSDAGTSLKTMMLNLQPSTKEQIAEFQRLGLFTTDLATATDRLTRMVQGAAGGQALLDKANKDGVVSTKELFKAAQDLGQVGLDEDFNGWARASGLTSNAFFDAQGKAKNFAEIAGILQGATKDMTDQQKLASLEILFGSDAIRAAAVVTKAGAEGFEGLAASMGKVSAESVADKRLDNLNGSLEQLRGSLETVQITLGQRFLPVLRQLVDGATNVANAFLNLDPSWQTAIATALVVATAVAGVTTVFLGLLAILPAVISGVGAAATIFGVVAGVLSGPVILAVGAVALAVAALLLAWNTNFGGIQDKAAAVWTFLSTEVFPPLQAALGWFTTTLLPEFLLTWNAISGKVTEVWNWLWPTLLKPGMAELSKDWADKWAAAQTILTGVWEVVKTTVSVIWPIVEGIILGGLKLVRGDWEGAWEAVKTGFQTAWERVKTLVGELVQGVLDALRKLAQDAAEAAKSVGEGIVNAIKKAIEDLGGSIKDALVNQVKSAIDAARKFANDNPVTTVVRQVTQAVTGGRGAGGEEEIVGGDLAAVAGPKAQAAIQKALALVGGGRDYIGWCERFVENMFGTSGRFATAWAAAQAITSSQSVNAPAGTMVFFRPDPTNANAGHVGISLGGGRFVSATNSGVTIDSLSNAYWRNLYHGYGVSPFAKGGWITEPIVGVGMNSGRGYTLGEKEAELVVPRSKLGASPPGASGGAGGDVHHHYHLTFSGAVFGTDVEDVVVDAIVSAQRRGRIA